MLLMRKYALFVLLFGIVSISPLHASAATTFEVSGWLPYWRSATSTRNVFPHLDPLTELNPVVYTLRSDGPLLDNGKLDEEPWPSFIAAAKAKKVRVIPTIMTGNGEALHDILSDTKRRIALEDEITKTVKEKGFDGIDIDFEGKKAADKDNFSAFLKGLGERLNGKWLMCTIESRTPLDSRYYGTEVPPDAEIYANDLVAISRYCDRVRIMAYDQQGIDLKLGAQAASSSQLYAPVADPAWVEKVINLMTKSIAKDKIMIGIPTYGYEYAVTAYANNQYVYDILWTFNPGYATQMAQQYGVTPSRAAWGEMQLSHIKDGASATSSPTTSMQYSALAAAAASSQFATQGNTHIDFRYLVWPDAESIRQKIALAQKLGVRGVSIFKLDGGEDQGIWNVLGSLAQTAVITSPPAPVTLITPTITFSRGLGAGAQGADVKKLQQVLNQDAATQVATSGIGSPGRESSYFGAATQRAVQKFQVKYGIAKKGSPGYGYVGPVTRAKLNALTSG